MSATLEELDAWLSEPEAERLEFKEAKSNFHFETLARYCAALANEGGGKITFGATDRRPRRVVGSSVYEEPGRTVAGLVDRIGIQVTSEEIQHPNGRVLVFHLPPRPVGVPIQYDGVFWARAGDELRPLSQDRLRRIFQESGPDFSAELHPEATIDDLDPALIERFREMWMRKSGNTALASLTARQLLEDAELLAGDKVTHAALILLGTRPALGRRLAQAELVFEYRNSEASIPFQQRIEFRSGFLKYLDELWNTINLRNEVLQYREGFFVGDIPAFNEAVVREGVLNALAHRDYRLPGSIFVRQFPRRLEIVSPGGFPPGINAANMLWRQSPRNRRIADACAKCGLVERSGQGANRMSEESIKEGKPRPDFTGTDDYQVELTLRGEIQNPAFLGCLQKIGAERLATFGTRDILVLDAIQREEPLPEDLRSGFHTSWMRASSSESAAGVVCGSFSRGSSTPFSGSTAPTLEGRASTARRTRLFFAGTSRRIGKPEAHFVTWSRSCRLFPVGRCRTCCKSFEQRAESAWPGHGGGADGIQEGREYASALVQNGA